MNFKLAIIITIILSIISLGSISLLDGNRDFYTSHQSCIASLATNATCPQQTNIPGYLAFHLQASKAVASAVFNASLLLLLLSIFAFVIVQSFLISRQQPQPLSSYIFNTSQDFQLSFRRQQQQWLARLRQQTAAQF